MTINPIKEVLPVLDQTLVTLQNGSKRLLNCKFEDFMDSLFLYRTGTPAEEVFRFGTEDSDFLLKNEA